MPVRRIASTRTAALVIAALAAALIVIASAGTAPAADTNPVQVTFNGSGTYTVNQGYSGGGGSCATHDVMSLSWVATFDTNIENGRLDGAVGSLAAGIGPGNASLEVSGPCADPRVGGGSCTAALGEALTPSLSVSGTDPAHVEAQSLPGSLTFSGCSGDAQIPFLGSDLSTLEAALPDALTATASIPLSTLGRGVDQTFPVSSASAPGQVASDCAGVGRHGTGNTGCSATLSWSGTLTVRRTCPPGEEAGTVTFLEGTATATSGGAVTQLTNGSTICKGDTLITGPNSRLEVTLKDGSIVRLGPDSATQVNEADYSGGERKFSAKLLLGKVWAKVSTALGGGSKFEVTTDRALAGVRGRASGGPGGRGGLVRLEARKGGSTSMTLDISNHRYPDLVHVVSGAAAVSFGKERASVAAGFGAYFKQKVRLTSSWPSDDRALLPAIELPPVISGLKKSVRSGKAKVMFKLDQPASVLLEVTKGRQVVVRRRTVGRRGRNAVALPKLHKGRYAFQLEASHKGLVSVALSSVRVS